MKTLFLVLALSLSLYSSSALKLKAQILSTIAHALIHQDKIKICTDNKELSKIKNYDLSLQLVPCKKAEIAFTSDVKRAKTICKTKIIFATNYYVYKHNPDAIGVFFWQKGRPNIIFREKALKKFHIKLPHKFDIYEE